MEVTNDANAVKHLRSNASRNLQCEVNAAAHEVLKTYLEHCELGLNLGHEQLHQDFIKSLRAFLDDGLQLLQLRFQLLARHNQQCSTASVKHKTTMRV